MAVGKTSLSAGEIIRAVLLESTEVTARVNKIFPVVEDNAELPYIVYRRTQMEQANIKTLVRADTIAVEVLCYTKDYTSGVELAEAVRGALDGIQATNDGLTMRSCVLSDSEEAWQNDAFVQQLVFTIKL